MYKQIYSKFRKITNKNCLVFSSLKELMKTYVDVIYGIKDDIVTISCNNYIVAKYKKMED